MDGHLATIMRMKWHYKVSRAVLAAALAIAAVLMASVPADMQNDPFSAMTRVLEADSHLGAIRNHNVETMPIAEAIRRYVEGLDALELDHCPDEFVRALQNHREAWNQSIAFFEQFSELRGELHEVFEMIRARDEASSDGLQKAEAEIWSTWTEVEEAVNQYDPAGKHGI